MSFNPYEPPASAYDGNHTNPNAGAVLSDAIVGSLRKTRPWVLFLAIMGFVGAGIMALVAVLVITEIPAGSLLYAVFAAVVGIPAFGMYRYAKAINKLLHGGGLPELEGALAAQASFWQIAGILTLIYLALIVVGSIAAAFVGASMIEKFGS
jgi:hypothetical protein